MARSYHAAIVTVSDSVAGGTREDLSGPAVFFEGGNIVAKAPVNLGDGNAAITLWQTTGSVDFANMAIAGSGTSVAAADIAMSGVAVGDLVFAVPIVSLPDRVFWNAACYSAGAVHVKALQNGSGAFDVDNVTFRIFAIKVA